MAQCFIILTHVKIEKGDKSINIVVVREFENVFRNKVPGQPP